MDTTESICRMVDSFRVVEVPPEIELDPYVPSLDSLTRVSIVNGNDDLSLFYDISTNEKNIREEDRQNSIEGIDNAKRAITPVKPESLSIFSDRDGIILANLDMIFHFTGDLYAENDMDRRNKKIFAYVIVGLSNGFVEYLQYRCTESVGFGMAPRGSSTNTFQGGPWDIKSLNMKRFKALYGSDATGDVPNNASWMVNFLLTTASDKMDLVICAEPIYFISSVLIALSILTKNGNAIFRLGNELDPSILFTLVQSFDRSHFFYPFTDNPNNQYRYLVCWGRRDDSVIMDTLNIFSELMENSNSLAFSTDSSQTNTNEIGVREALTFVEWFRRSNRMYAERWSNLLNERNRALSTSGYEYSNRIDLDKVKLILSIPLKNRELHPRCSVTSTDEDITPDDLDEAYDRY